jgi:dTDP-4-amino-4,6-dideoxygalactose transaminase
MHPQGGGTDMAANAPAPFLPFALPDIGEAEIAEVVDALRSGWVTTGPKTKRFESDFAAFLGEGIEAVAVNSATAGLHLALEALGVGPGDEVITTTHTFTATAEVARYLGAEPVLVDIERDTLCMDPAQTERAITPRTKVLLPVHFGGRAAAMDHIGAIAARHGLAVVEDAAHALPTTHQGKLIGTLASDATVFSFYANKAITTGEGGMLVTRRPEVARRARVMRLHGMSRDTFDRFTAKVPGWRYEIIAPGFKYNMTDVAAAIGIHQLPRVADFQKKRASIAARYDRAFAELPVRLPPPALPGDLHAWHLYVLQLAPSAPVGRDQFIEQLFAMNIGCSVHYIPLHEHPYWRDRYHLTPEMFPVSDDVFRCSVSLPIYTRMTDADVARVIAAVTTLLSR